MLVNPLNLESTILMADGNVKSLAPKCYNGEHAIFPNSIIAQFFARIAFSLTPSCSAACVLLIHTVTVLECMFEHLQASGLVNQEQPALTIRHNNRTFSREEKPHWN